MSTESTKERRSEAERRSSDALAPIALAMRRTDSPMTGEPAPTAELDPTSS